MAATEGNEHEFYRSENNIMNKKLKGEGGGEKYEQCYKAFTRGA